MRKKLTVGQGLLAIAVSAVLAYLLIHRSPNTVDSPTLLPLSRKQPAAHAIAETASPINAHQPSSKETPNTTSVAMELADIEKLLIERDSKVVSTLLNKLRHPSKEVREAALDGIMLIDDSSAALGLRQIANATRDSQESAEWLRSADFLELPPAKLDFNQPNPAATPRPSDVDHFPFPR